MWPQRGRRAYHPAIGAMLPPLDEDQRLAALANLQQVAVGVLELRDVAPWELEHV
jgi:hypothetical protein